MMLKTVPYLEEIWVSKLFYIPIVTTLGTDISELVLATNRLSLLGDSNVGNLVILSLGNFTRVLFGTNVRLDWVPLSENFDTKVRLLGTNPDNNVIPIPGYNGTIV